VDPGATLLAAWRTNSRVTAFLVEQLPAAAWGAGVPGAPRQTIRGLAAHLHNARVRWIRTLGQEHGISAPAMVDRHTIARGSLLPHLRRSSRGVEAVLSLGIEAGGVVPPSKGYVWRNLPLDVGHVMTYFVAHEGHHRGQILLAARLLGHRLPAPVTGGLWQWSRRSQESR